MCGASASSEATRCEHCGARLATVACPSCFGMMFIGQKFCPHCGARAERTELKDAPARLCPRCQTGMKAVELGKIELLECPRCEGVWLDKVSLEEICADRERQAAVLGMPSQLPQDQTDSIEKIRYVPCPVCRKLMNRVNFARCSHVVVDVCAQHGTWFDRDELRRTVEFIRAGGLDQAREKEVAELEREKRELKTAQIGSAWEARPAGSSEGLSSLLGDLFGWRTRGQFGDFL